MIGAGYALAHWNFAAIGRSTLAADVEDNQFTAVHTAFDSAGLGIPSVSGTFNMIHPDADLRARQIELDGPTDRPGTQARLPASSLCAPALGIQRNMWRAHSGNTDPSAWSDLRRSLDPPLEVAREAGIRLGSGTRVGQCCAGCPRCEASAG